MLLFNIVKKDLQRALKHLNGTIKIKKKNKVLVTCEIFLEPGILCIRLHGIESYVKCENEYFGEFKMYFTELYEVMERINVKYFDTINFVLTEKMLQINNIPLYVISTNLKNSKQNEKPLGILNYDNTDSDEIYTQRSLKTYKLRHNKEEVLEHNIINDIKNAMVFLKKYNVNFNEIETLVKEKMIEYTN